MHKFSFASAVINALHMEAEFTPSSSSNRVTFVQNQAQFYQFFHKIDGFQEHNETNMWGSLEYSLVSICLLFKNHGLVSTLLNLDSWIFKKDSP